MTLPQFLLTAQAAKRVRHYDCLVFPDEVARGADESLPPGEPVEIVDQHDQFLAYAFYNPRSHVALRVTSLSQDAPPDRRWLEQRLRVAVARREALRETTAKRLVFSEADGLPGLIVDRYAEYLVVQIRSAGMDRFRADIVSLLQEIVGPKGILERSDKEFREEEGLPPATQVLAGAVPERIEIEESGLRFLVDAHHGLKTGFYLDQRPTRQRLRQWVQPGQQVLDTFSYTGSLGIAAAASGGRVVCVEQLEAHTALGKENAALNGVSDRIEWVSGDAFYWLPSQAKANAKKDWVIVDPPALAKTKQQQTAARQALHHLTTNALALLTPGGKMVLSVCSYHLLAVTEEIVRIAAAEHGRRLWVRSQWVQPEDHPWILQIPPTRYLASWCLEYDALSAA